MSAFWLLTVARAKEFLREPGAVFWTFGFPLLMTVALGLAFRQNGVPSQVVGVTEGPRAEATAQAITSPRIAPRIMPQGELVEALRRAKIVIGVDGNADGAVYYLDPSRPDAAAARLAVDDALQRAAGRQDARDVRIEAMNAPGSRYIDWLVPGLLGMQLMMGGLWGVGWVLVEQRSRKLLKRIVATPMPRAALLLSTVSARMVMILFEIVVILGFAALTFDLRVKGSLPGVAFVSFYGAFCFAGLGLLIGSRAQNTQTAGGLMNLAMLPMSMLSGVFFTSANFPQWLQPIITWLPLTALNEALRALINDGASLFEQGPKLLILTVWGLVSFVLALRFFRWS